MKDILYSSQPSVMSLACAVLALALMGLLLAVNHGMSAVPAERGFGVFTVFFMLTVVLGAAALLCALYSLLDDEGRALGMGGLVAAGIYWLLYWLNLGWTNAFNVVLMRDLF
jgi:drug/metabolite transporter (DMT)-like permease